MPLFVQTLLQSSKLWLFYRCLMALLFLFSGFAKVINVEASFAEMQAVGLSPAWLFNYASALILVSGSYFILFNKAVWFGAGLLSVFLLLTIVIVHRFWEMSGMQAVISLYFALEHLAVIAGLIMTAMLSHSRKLLQQLETGVIA